MMNDEAGSVMIDVEWRRACAAARQDGRRALWVGALVLINVGAWQLRLLPPAPAHVVALALTAVCVRDIVVAYRRRLRLKALWALKAQRRDKR